MAVNQSPAHEVVVSVEVSCSLELPEPIFRAYMGDFDTDLDDLVREFCRRVEGGELGPPLLRGEMDVTVEFDTRAVAGEDRAVPGPGG